MVWAFIAGVIIGVVLWDDRFRRTLVGWIIAASAAAGAFGEQWWPHVEQFAVGMF